MSALSEKIRKAREKNVEVGGYVFTIRRPTDIDMLDFSKTRKPEDLVRFVVGWENVKEIDLIPGGDGHPTKFDADACAEWLADRSDLFVPVINAVIDAYHTHKAEIEAAEKN